MFASLNRSRSTQNSQQEFAVAGTRKNPTNVPVASRPDDGAEATEHQKPCAVESVIPGTSKEVRGFVENVNRISATEVVEHERINKDGVVIEQKHHKFNDVAEIQETRPGIWNMDEYRDGSPGQSGSPGELSMVGITSVLIFHPYHLKEFEMTCEGTENWRGRAA
jgi:hypothetical protein